jgi:hypothetical protein
LTLPARRALGLLDAASIDPVMLKLTTENLETLRMAAAPIDPRDRARFCEAVAEAVRDYPDPGAGEFSRLCRAIASRFRRARSGIPDSDVIDGRA